MKELVDAFKQLARRYHSRWSKLDDALALVRIHEDGGHTKKGERTRRILDNAFRVTTYPEKAKETLRTDRAVALSKLQKPLAEAIGHLITIEAADALLEEIRDCEAARASERGEAVRIERWSVYSPLLQALHESGVNRGHWSALTATELTAIAKFIRRKAEAREAKLPPLRTASETRAQGERLHMFWSAYPLTDQKGQ